MKVIDCFIFNHELDLLELRLMEIGDYVDEVVLVEMPHNFMQQPKPLHFNENKDRFEKWLPKIRHIVIREYNIAGHPEMEYFQRRGIREGLVGCMPDDIIMISDVDEIPTRGVLDNVRRLPPDHPFVCLQRLYYYYVNCQQNAPWAGTVIGPRHSFPPDIDCQQIRFDRHNFPRIEQCGWHFSWLGPLEQLKMKLDSIDVTADAKLYNTPDIVKPSTSDTTFLERCLETGEDLFGRTDEIARKSFVPIEPGVRQPTVIREWLAMHPQYVKYGDDHVDYQTENAEVPRRKRGRPKGSKNKPKPTAGGALR